MSSERGDDRLRRPDLPPPSRGACATVTAAVPATPPDVAVIVAVPLATAVTMPCHVGRTIAMDAAVLDHDTADPSHHVAVLVTHHRRQLNGCAELRRTPPCLGLRRRLWNVAGSARRRQWCFHRHCIPRSGPRSPAGRTAGSTVGSRPALSLSAECRRGLRSGQTRFGHPVTLPRRLARRIRRPPQDR